MAQSVVPQKEKKVEAVFAALGCNHDEKLFADKFKELYPNDWVRIKKVYFEHESKEKKDKGHPMPHPEKYLGNMYKVYVNKKK
jgi:hypothetical protein